MGTFSLTTDNLTTGTVSSGPITITVEPSAPKPCCANHNRLDKIRHIDHYQHLMCGTPDPMTREPDYCCFKCPVLHGKESQPDLSGLANFRPTADDSLRKS